MTVRDWLGQATARLREVGVESARLDAQVLAAHVLEVDRSWLYAHPEAEIPPSAEKLLQLRANREPLAYILGYREFYGRKFRVRPGVLVPRQETEVLVEHALRRMNPESSVLDIGTGTGCIGITLKLERPDFSITASDVAPIPLELAAENAILHDADVTVVRSDLFANLDGLRFDWVVSNPPYIPLGEVLVPEVGRFEPGIALFAEDGLAIYRRLAAEGRAATSRMLVEIGAGQAEAVTAIYASQGWTRVATIPDLSRIDRVLEFRAMPKWVNADRGAE